MELLQNNLSALLEDKGSSLEVFLKSKGVKSVDELPLATLRNFCFEENIDLVNLLSYNLTVDKSKLKSIKLLILDVDGVMTNGGMYFAESGDQYKKYNAKDGMAIMALHNTGILTGIISSGFKLEVVKSRADLLKIDRLYVGREPKMNILKEWCEELNIELSEVGMIGDDINDLEVMKSIGFSAAPSDAVPVIKKHVDLVLSKRGGDACVREFIDHYLLDKPLGT